MFSELIDIKRIVNKDLYRVLLQTTGIDSKKKSFSSKSPCKILVIFRTFSTENNLQAEIKPQTNK